MMEGMGRKGDDIRGRLVDFAVAAINLCEQIPETQAGSHISLQHLRGTESARDFVHKLGIVLKELNGAFTESVALAH